VDGLAATPHPIDWVMCGISGYSTGYSAEGKFGDWGAPDRSVTEKEIRQALRKGDIGMRKIAVEFGVGSGTVQRIAHRMRS
jgi:hypothetical protein